MWSPKRQSEDDFAATGDVRSCGGVRPHAKKGAHAKKSPMAPHYFAAIFMIHTRKKVTHAEKVHAQKRHAHDRKKSSHAPKKCTLERDIWR